MSVFADGNVSSVQRLGRLACPVSMVTESDYVTDETPSRFGSSAHDVWPSATFPRCLSKRDPGHSSEHLWLTWPGRRAFDFTLSRAVLGERTIAYRLLDVVVFIVGPVASVKPASGHRH